MIISFISLGCDKNLVDSEVMLGIIRDRGYELTDDETKAEIIVVNTCCFINDAKEESINTILEMGEYKKTGVLKALIVTGCLAERYKEEIQKEIPEVDAVIGTTSYDNIANVIEQVLEGKKTQTFTDINHLPKTNTKRILTTGGYYAYLKIAEGCNKRCTYCIIPKVRGNYRSVEMEELITSAKQLTEGGVKELILVAQEVTLYGKDIYNEKSLHKLLKELCKIEELEWIRILYCYPEEIYEELIQTIKTEPKICHYLDMPIQHSSNRILKLMGRNTNKDELIKTINNLRHEIPDIVLRTTLITGFPGETKDDHEQLLEFVETMKFNRLGVFTYSLEEDTIAANMPDQIEESVKLQRKEEIMLKQQEVAFTQSKSIIGKTLKVIIEGRLTEDNEDILDYIEENEERFNKIDRDIYTYMGRTYMDSPNVDGYIFINSRYDIISGEFVDVLVTGSYEYDLIGEIVDEFT